MRKHILLLIALVTFASSVFAQRTEPQETKSQFGRRAAKIPQSDADTGLEFNEVSMKREAAKYFYDLRTSGEIKDLALIEKIGYEEFKKMQGAVALKQQSIPVWEQVGGDQDGHNAGRSRSIAFKGTNTLYVAFAQGGIWKTDNINDQQPTWVCLTDKLESIAFGAVIADPRNGDIVYAGTGEDAGAGFSIPPGSGLFKTLDGGLNWFKILGTDTLGTRCLEIAMNPKNPDILYIATGSQKSGTAGGVVKTTDAGLTWQVSTLTGFSPLDIEIDPEDTARLYVSGNGKIFRSTNSGGSWQQLTSGLPTASVGRIELAIAPSAPNLVYASIGKSNDSTLGLWLSTDRGDTWKTLSGTTSNSSKQWLGMQQSYATGIVVHPTIPRQVFLGGLDIWRTNDSGKTFSDLSDWFAQINDVRYSHADVHGMYYVNGAIFVNTDGGISISKNGGNSWTTTINKGIATLQFVNVDADKDFSFVLGGTQDNGTNRALTTDKQFTESRGGDGGYVNIVQSDPKICYSEYVEGDMFKHINYGIIPPPWEQMNPPFKGAARFYMPFDFDATGSFGIAGASGLYITQSGGAGSGAWTRITTPSISNASAVHVFPSDPTYMWAATGANFYRSTDAGTTFTKGTTNPAGASTITGIVADPSNPLNVWICSQGIGASNKHVYKSTDGGATFTALPNFPNIGCNWIARRPSTGGLFVATDKGVLYSVDEGQSWFALEQGLPNVQVLTVKVRGNDNQWLLAGTYGRGMFKLNIGDLTSTDQPKTAPSSSVVTLNAVSPNPITNGNGSVNFSLMKNTVVTATLYDVLGRTVKILAKSPFAQGKHSLNFTTNELPSGAYIISVAAEGVAKTQRVVIE